MGFLTILSSRAFLFLGLARSDWILLLNRSTLMDLPKLFRLVQSLMSLSLDNPLTSGWMDFVYCLHCFVWCSRRMRGNIHSLLRYRQSPRFKWLSHYTPKHT